MRIGLPVLLVLLSIGCYSSEVALDAPDDLGIDTRFAGEWSFPAAGKQPAFTVAIRPADDKRGYDIDYNDGKKHIEGVAVIIPIKKVNFVQIRPRTAKGQPVSQEHLMLRVSIEEGNLGVQQLNPYFFYTKRLTAPDHLRDLLEQNIGNGEMYQGDWRYGTKRAE
jgi:hypothetical protein